MRAALQSVIQIALSEDVGPGDRTAQYLIPDTLQGTCQCVAREALVLCGIEVPALVYEALGGGITVEPHHPEGTRLQPGAIIATCSGALGRLLTGERTLLNLMQRMCAVATLTRRYVDAVAGTGVTILDTRKTMPGLRLLDKYAVRVGGGANHRMGLYDGVMVKDNHIAGMTLAEPHLQENIARIRREAPGLPVIIECDHLEQLPAIINLHPDRILLDNMTAEILREAVAITARRVPLEASGGITLQNIRAIAETGIDYISVGALTHSAPTVDIALDVVQDPVCCSAKSF